MIGGNDTYLAGAPAAGEGELIERLLRYWWPHLVVERDDPHGFFVYRSADAKAAWERDGASTETSGTMIHVVVGSESMTIVSDVGGSKTYAIAQAVRRAVLAMRVIIR